MKYEPIEVNGDYKELINELNNSKNYTNHELVSFQTYKTMKGVLYTKAILKCPELKEIVCEEKRTPKLGFAEHFPKLNNEEFTTIRDHDKEINVGEIVNIIAPEGRRFKAKCTSVEQVKFDKLNNDFVSEDLSLPQLFNEPLSLESCLGCLNDYYPNLSMDSLVWIYTLQKQGELYNE